MFSNYFSFQTKKRFACISRDSDYIKQCASKVHILYLQPNADVVNVCSFLVVSVIRNCVSRKRIHEILTFR